MSSQQISLSYILILFSHLCLGLPRGPFPSSFPSKTPYAFLLSPICTTSPARLIIISIIIIIIIFFFSSCVGHTTLIKISNLVLSKARLFASFQLYPACCNSHSIALFQFVPGLPLFLIVWGFYTKVCLFIAPCPLPTVWPILSHFHSLFFVQYVFVLFSVIIPHLKFYPANWPLRQVAGIDLQKLEWPGQLIFPYLIARIFGKLLKKFSAFQDTRIFKMMVTRVCSWPKKPIVPYKRNKQGRTRATPKALLTYLLTYSMEQSPSWEANWFCS